MNSMLARGPPTGPYTDDSGLGSYSSSALGSARSSLSSSATYLVPSSQSDRVDSSSFADGLPLPPVNIRLRIPELNIETNLQLNQNDTAWNIKQYILSTIATNLDDGINHGLFCPPVNGRAGKYLDEERFLGEYGLRDDTVLQLVQKKRLYKTSTFDWKKIQEYNTKARCKKLLHHLRYGNFDPLKRLLTKGLDPNFQDSESGETPLTMAVGLRYARDLIMILIEGGAILDYRNHLGLTSLHRAAQIGNREAVQTLLELGASPNYKDIRGLTPLYYSVCNDTDPGCVELLLRDYGTIGTRDDAGWTEIHQVCRSGRLQHLEHLIFYGCDVNSRNYSGNTPLHLCALNNQEECARLLLFRGADKTIRNFINQDPECLALFSGFHRLAEVIRRFNPRDAVIHQEAPLYNSRRRRLSQSARCSDDGSNLFFLHHHLSRSTSHLPDSSSELCTGSTATRKSSSELCAGSPATRKSSSENPYHSISRVSSLFRRSSRSKSSSSRPSSRLAFEEPDIRSPPQKNPSNLMSCDAASQRARARSRSRSRNALGLFKDAKKEDLDYCNDRCSSGPPPSSPPATKALPGTPVAHPVTLNQNISCLREVLRPRFELGARQENSQSVTRSYQGHEVEGRHDRYDAVGTGYQMKNDHVMPGNQAENESHYLISREQFDDGGDEKFGRHHTGNSPATRQISHVPHDQKPASRNPFQHPSEEIFVWTKGRSQGSRNLLTENKGSRGYHGGPPPPPPRRTTPPSGFGGISEDGKFARCRHPSTGLPAARDELVDSRRMSGCDVQSAHRHHGNALRGGEPAYRGVGHASVSSRDDVRGSVLSRSCTDQSRDRHVTPKPFRITSPPSSPLPPFPETVSPFSPNYQHLPPLPLPPPPPLSHPLPPPPPLSDLPNGYLPPPPMFSAGSPGFPAFPESASRLQSPVVRNDRSGAIPTTSRNDGMTGEVRVTDVARAVKAQSALFAVIQRRIQAQEQLCLN